MDSASLTAALKSEAMRLGFDLVGACPAVSPPHLAAFSQWLSAGYAGQMRWLPERAEAYSHPRNVLEGSVSLLVLATGYRTAESQPAEAGCGRVSRYAWGRDYHDVIHERLKRLAELHRRLAPDAAVRGVVDTAPLIERDFAQLAGLGWIGKNTMLIHPSLGSYTFLAVLLSGAELIYDQPWQADRCGTCRACLDACPTGALVDAYRLDARQCISYLTIELKESVPDELRPLMGEWVFGCDMCQEVCPWNRHAAFSREPAFAPNRGTNPLDLAALLELDDAGFREQFRGTPLARAKRSGLLRNAAIVLGNRPAPGTRPALDRGSNDADPVVREACVKALSEHNNP